DRHLPQSGPVRLLRPAAGVWRRPGVCARRCGRPVVPLNSGPELLESAVSYALAGAGMATRQPLSRPTPCPGWNLETLLDHLSDSIGVLHEALTTGNVAAITAPGRHGPGPDPVARLEGQAALLLADRAAAGPTERLVVIGDREVTASMIVVAGAIEITV